MNRSGGSGIGQRKNMNWEKNPARPWPTQWGAIEEVLPSKVVLHWAVL